MKFNEIKRILEGNKSDLFLTAGISAMIGGTVFAFKNSKKIDKIKHLYRNESRKEQAKKLIPLYLPSALLTAGGIFCIIHSRNITKNKMAALATAYTVTGKAYKIYRDSVEEVVDEKAKEEIKKKVCKKKVAQSNTIEIPQVEPGSGDVIIFDDCSGRYFKSTINKIDAIINDLNQSINRGKDITLNDIYYELDLTPIKIGCELGWEGYGEHIEVRYSGDLSENGYPVVAMELSNMKPV